MDEKRLDELLEYTPGYTEQNAQNIEGTFLEKVGKTQKKRTPAKRILLVAAAVAVSFVVLSGAALAVSTALGFDFTQLGYGRIGKLYDSFFGNPSSGKDVINVGKSVENNGIKVTLLSAYTDLEYLYALLELTDLEGDRLSEYIYLWEDNWEVGGGRQYFLTHSGTAVYDKDTKTATLVATMLLREKPNIGDELALEINEILVMWYEKDGTQVEQNIAGPWSIGFTVEKETSVKKLTAPVPDNSPFFKSIEATSTPIHTTIWLYANDSEAKERERIGQLRGERQIEEDRQWQLERLRYFASFGNPYLTMDDGSTVELMLTDDGYWSALSSWYSAMGSGYDNSGTFVEVGTTFIEIRAEYFDSDSLRSITIFGEVYYFDKGDVQP
jgi:hypothetical protein